MLNHKDSILEGVRAFDLVHLQALAAGTTSRGNEAQLKRLEAKGWLERHGDVHLITLTGRTLIDHPPASAQ